MRYRTQALISAVALLWLGGLAVYLLRAEVPTGRINGRAIADETGRPLARTLVTLQLLFPHPEGARQTFTLRAGKDGRFRSGRIPAGFYRVQAASRAHALAAATLNLQEGEVREVTLELSPDAPFLDLRMPHRVYLPEETPELTAHGFSPQPTLTFHLYRVDVPTLLARHEGRLSDLVNNYTQGKLPEQVLAKGEAGLTRVSEVSQSVTQRDVEGIFTQRFPLPVHEPGLYVLDVATDDPTHVHRLEWLAVSRIGLIAKHWGDQVLAYVADLKTGAPVAGARVQFAAQGVPPVTGTTDGQGMLLTRVTGKGTRGHVFGLAEKEGSQAFVEYWSYLGGDEEEGGEGGNVQERVYCYTDRPVYRPGHLAYFKGIVRTVDGDTYRVPANKPVRVEVKDSRDTLIYQGRFTTDRFGSFNGSFTLSDEAATGLYSITSSVDDRPHESNFKVAEYRKPEYAVQVTMDKKRYTRGEDIQASVSAQYYFGAPVAGANVKYQVMRSPYWFHPDSDEDFLSYGMEGESDYYDYGDVISQGEAKTDEQGLAHFTISTRERRPQAEGEELAETADSRYIIEATVTDPSRKEVSERGSAIVTQGEFAILAEPVDWIVTPGQPARITVRTRDYDGKPVRGVVVSASARQEVWRNRGIDLGAEIRGRVTTDARGAATYTFTPPDEGSYRIRFTATDRRGNRITDDASLWVTERTYSDLPVEYPDLEIVTDKKHYQKGDTAVLLINTRNKGATALLTVEGIRLYERRLIQLSGSTTRVELPLKPEYAPNCYVSVALIHAKQYAEAEKEVLISVADRKLAVQVKADKQTYGPGDRVTYSLLTRDARGKPVSAQASLGVVDESIYAVQEELATPMLRFFYPPRENAIETTYSFASIYLDANKEPVAIKVRKRFPDTAYWNPTVVTDENGRATLSFAMPDTLTTWRATVRAATLDTAVGEATAKVRTTKDLLVRLEAPRFVTQDDRVTLSAVTHNYTRQRQDVQVWITAPGMQFASSRAARPVRFTLDPGGVRRQDWVVQAATVGRPEITVYAKAPRGLSDAMALPLPVLPHGRARVESRAGSVRDRVNEQFIVRTDAIAGATDLRLRLAPSLAAVMFGALDYLAEYPWGCTEQTVSAFLPDVVVSHTLHELSIRDPKLEKRLPDMVRKGFDRLYGFQHDDGGWGWSRYDHSDPWMTAYVVDALLIARRSGFTVNDGALNRGLEWLTHRLAGGQEPSLRNRAYVLDMLALAGKKDAAGPELDKLRTQLGSLDTSGLAYAAQAWLNLGRTNDARAAANLLWKRASGSPSLLSWQAPEPNYKLNERWLSDTEATALAFQVLSALFPDDPRLSGVVRWLVLNRRGDHWCSTRDTAFIIYALTPYLKRAGELTPDYQAAVTLDGKAIWSGRITKDDVFAPEIEVRLPAQALLTGGHQVTLTKSGPGQLYYTAVFTQSIGGESLTQLLTGSDIQVERQYFHIRSARDPSTGALRTFPDSEPTTDFRAGEPILARLVIRSVRPHDYMLVENPLPAGCEVSDRGDLEPWEWDHWYSDMDVRDDKVAFFIDMLPAGKTVLEYHLRPQIPGEFHALPSVVYSMYDPSVRSAGAETEVRLR